MIQVREAVADDAAAIAGLLGELGYPASALDIPSALVVSGGRKLVRPVAG